MTKYPELPKPHDTKGQLEAELVLVELDLPRIDEEIRALTVSRNEEKNYEKRLELSATLQQRDVERSRLAKKKEQLMYRINEIK